MKSSMSQSEPEEDKVFPPQFKIGDLVKIKTPRDPPRFAILLSNPNFKSKDSWYDVTSYDIERCRIDCMLLFWDEITLICES